MKSTTKEMNLLKVNSRLSLKEYVQLAFKLRFSDKLLFLDLCWVLCLAFLVYLSYTNLTNTQENSVVTLQTLTILLLVFLAYPLYIYYRYKKIYASPLNLLKDPIEVEFYDNEIKFSSELLTKKMAIEKITSLKIFYSYIIFYFDDDFIIINRNQLTMNQNNQIIIEILKMNKPIS